MHRTALLAAAAMLLAAAIPAATPSETLSPATDAVRWDVSGTRAFDVTCDGRSDVIMAGYGRKALWISVGTSGRNRKVIQFHFGIGPGEQAAVCSVPVHIAREQLYCEDEEYGHLQGCKPISGCSGFAVVDDRCDSIHFFWNARAKRLEWFRH